MTTFGFLSRISLYSLTLIFSKQSLDHIIRRMAKIEKNGLFLLKEYSVLLHQRMLCNIVRGNNFSYWTVLHSLCADWSW
jgi:hypothetical protein